MNFGNSFYGSFGSLSGADTVFGSSRSRYSSHTSYKSQAMKRYNSTEFPPPSRNSFYGSFGSLSGADTVLRSSRSRYSSHTSYESGAIKRYNSISFPPPSMSGDERSDSWSVGSSAYSSLRSLSEADSSSVLKSSRSKVSSHSSGFGSLQSIPESVEHSETKRAHGKPKISKLFPRILQKHDKHEEDT